MEAMETKMERGRSRQHTFHTYSTRTGHSDWTLVTLARGRRGGERYKEGGSKWVTTVGQGCLK